MSDLSITHVRESLMRPTKGRDRDPLRVDIRVYGDGPFEGDTLTNRISRIVNGTECRERRGKAVVDMRF